MSARFETVQDLKQRRDAVLAMITNRVPFIGFMGVQFDRRGNELTSILPFDEKFIGNATRQALHGGATASFLETTAIVELFWHLVWEEMEAGAFGQTGERTEASFEKDLKLPSYPKTIDITIDYLRPGLPRDAYARAFVNRSGRRYASVRVEAWQDLKERPFAQATAHFLVT